MISVDTKIRVRYSETDQAGFVYYGNYAQYYEVGRTEAIKQSGFSYRDMEARGIIMPIITMNATYIKPARYYDLLTVRTIVREIPRSRMKFEYEIFNESGDLLNKAETVLAFISAKNYKPVRAPEWFISVLEKSFD